MDINKAKELYKNFQLKQKEKRDKMLLQTYVDLEDAIQRGKKCFYTDFYLIVSDKEWNNWEKIDIKKFFDKKVFIKECGVMAEINDNETTFNFFYQEFISQGFKVSLDWVCSPRLINISLSGWADDK